MLISFAILVVSAVVGSLYSSSSLPGSSLPSFVLVEAEDRPKLYTDWRSMRPTSYSLVDSLAWAIFTALILTSFTFGVAYGGI